MVLRGYYNGYTMKLRAYIPALVSALIAYYWYGDLEIAFLVALATAVAAIPFKRQNRRYVVRMVS